MREAPIADNKVSMPKLEKSLRAVLQKAATERPVQRWLEQNPLVLSASLGGIAYPNKVVSQFKFGTDFIADFAAIGAYSGAIGVHLVELEPPGAGLFTKKGVAAQRLNGALAQIGAWKTFIAKKCPVVLAELAKVFKKRELVFGRGTEPTDTTGMALHDPRQHVTWYFHIVIGRRDTLTKEDLERKTAYFTQAEVDVMTHDRLLETAGGFDQTTELPLYHPPVKKVSLQKLWREMKKKRGSAKRLA